MNDHFLYDDYYSYTPLDEWKHICSVFASRVDAPGGERERPVYEILKQLSTSCMSVDFHPFVAGDGVFFCAHPAQSDPTKQLRAGISPRSAHQVQVHLILPGQTEGRTVVYSRETAFPLLNTMLNRLGTWQQPPDALLPDPPSSPDAGLPQRDASTLQRMARRLYGLRSRFSSPAA